MIVINFTSALDQEKWLGAIVFEFQHGLKLNWPGANFAATANLILIAITMRTHYQLSAHILAMFRIGHLFG